MQQVARSSSPNSEPERREAAALKTPEALALEASREALVFRRSSAGL